ncbi:hypothetical protein ACFL1H_00985 [Nanoarchaeota archaeon]
MKIKGKIINSLNGANLTLKKQKKLFIDLGLPKVKDLFLGTINVQLDNSQYTIKKLDYTYWGVVWERHPHGGPKKCDTFGFIKIKKIVYEDKTYSNPGYLYFPSGSPHLAYRTTLELYCKKLANVKAGNDIEIEIANGLLKIE